MVGTLTVQNLQGPTSGANANKVIIPSGHTLAAEGHVVQVQTGVKRGVVSTSSSSYVASGLGVSITPKFSNSKLLVGIHGGRPNIASLQQIDFTIYENTTALSSDRLGSFYHDSGGNIYSAGINYLNTVDVTSTTTRTYNLYYKSAVSGTVYLSDAGDISIYMTVMEVAR
jgi:hypothetical protein